MSRMYDRIQVAGIRPWHFADWPLRPAKPDEPTVPVDARLPAAQTTLAVSELDGATVLDVTDVAHYLAGHSARLSQFDLITTVTAPFDRMFVEYPCVGPYRERHGIRGVGVLVEQVEFEDEFADDPDPPRWGLSLTHVFESRKGDFCGPVGVLRLFIGPDGKLLREAPRGRANGGVKFVRQVPNWIDESGEDAYTEELVAGLWELSIPVLFALSLMHCRNVTAEQVEPGEKISRAHLRRHGSPLTRYLVLKIEPMRTVLDDATRSGGGDLGQAIHMCRGHFKSYGPEAPLFGRFTGQWWWHSHQRGQADHGVVTKDYAIALDGPGAPYRTAAEIPPAQRANKTSDPDAYGRGHVAHAHVQNVVAAALHSAGVAPCSPKSGEPPYDIGCIDRHGIFWVIEIKSMTAENAESQLRAALGQVLRYRQAMLRLQPRVRAAIVTECAAPDATWDDLFAAEGITFAWLGHLDNFVEATIQSSPK